MTTRVRPGVRVPVLVGIVATITFLVIAAFLTPDQSPILPIEISVVLAALASWFAMRGSRSSLGVLTAFLALLVLLSVHIITGDIGSSGAREIVPDLLILLSTLFAAGYGVRGLVDRPVRA